jgi:uncharacterized RDD family membrane protein YckC
MINCIKLPVQACVRGLLALVAFCCLAFGIWAQESNTAAPVPLEVPDAAQPADDIIDRQEIVRFGQEIVLKKNERSPVVVAIFGDVTIHGEVGDSVVVIGGTARITGKVRHQAVAVLGDIILGPEAEIGGDTVAVGGLLKADPKARMRGEQFELRLPFVPGFKLVRDWVFQALFWGRPMAPKLTWMWFVAGIFLVLYLLLQLLFPHATQTTVGVLSQKPLVSFALGLLAFILLGPLLTLVTITVIGIFFVPFFLCAFVGAVCFGKVAVHRFLGERIVGQFGGHSTQMPMAALVVGTGVVYALYLVPFLGFIVFGILTTLGLGAVLLAAFSGLERADRSDSISRGTGGVSGPPTAPTGGADSSIPSGNVASVSNFVSPAQPPALPLLTPSLSLPRVGFWMRLGATTLDFLMITIVFALMTFPVPPVFFLIWMAYHIGMWSLKGTTIGGIIFGIKCVRLDGGEVTFPVALIRCLSSWLSAVALFLGFFWAGWDANRQSWHDKIAGTTMVRVPKGASLVVV